MLRRQIRHELLERLESYPAVALVGPRQCGKTTLATSPGGLYFDLEQDRLTISLVSDKGAQ